jgi:hypothetical protein
MQVVVSSGKTVSHDETRAAVTKLQSLIKNRTDKIKVRVDKAC